MNIEQVVSGGQTGVDQASLQTASEMGIAIGGWCPKGGLDENGVCVLKKHPSLKEATTTDPDERTKLNVRDSDGTLIIVPNWPLPKEIKDGTRLTIEEAKRQKKPFLIVNLAAKQNAVYLMQLWICKHDISVLNVAGPRESSSPGIYQKSCNLFQELFTALKPMPRL